MKRQNIILFFICIIAVLLSGCWDRKEVNDLGLVTAAGIDKISDNTLELSVLVYIPKSTIGQQSMNGSGGGGTAQTLVRSAKGITIADAMSKLQEKLPRHIFWGHTEVFIFNEGLAKKGLGKHIDFIMRHPQLRERSEIFITNQNAKEMISLIPPLERDLATVLRELEALRIGMEVTVKDYAQMLISESGDTAVPWVQILPAEKGKEKKETIAYIAGTAIFKRDKMVGKIDDSVTRGVLWLRNEIPLATVTVKPPDTNGYISLNLEQGNSELVPRFENGKWKMELKIDAEADVIQNTTRLDTNNPVVLKSLQKQLKKEIEQRVNEALVHVQKEMKADIFGFAATIHRKYPQLWKKEKDHWDEHFPEIEVTVHSTIKIRRQGMNSLLLMIFPEEVKEK